MEYVRLGHTGLKVSRICLGMMTYGDPNWRDWVLGEQAAEPFVRQAAETGINFFDTADIYSGGASEEVTGALLRRVLPHREDYVLATKIFNPLREGVNQGGLSRKRIMAGIDESLRRLGVEYVDLYQIHRFDPETPVEETMQALHDVVQAGKARYLGASSMYAWQFAKMQHAADRLGLTRFVAMQNHYNLVYREEEREMIPQCLDMGVGVIPWSPLARGFLAGNRGRGGERHTVRSSNDPYAESLYTDADFDVVDRVTEVASGRGLPPAQVALAWLLHRPGVTAPIIGATKLSHLIDAVAAVDVPLSPDEMKILEEPYQPHVIRGH